MSTTLENLAGAGRARSAWRSHLAALSQSLASGARRLWDAYWDSQAHRATVVMLEALDDRTLKDIGLGRDDIHSAVLGSDATRRRSYDQYWDGLCTPDDRGADRIGSLAPTSSPCNAPKELLTITSLATMIGRQIMPRLIFLFVLVSGIVLGGGSSKAADVGDLSESGAGALALYVPVPGETVRCIDRRQDMLTVRLQNMGAIKSDGRWKITWPWQGFVIRVGATEKVGLHVRTTLEGVSESAAKDIVIDRAYLIDVKDQPTGRVSLVSQDNLFKELYLQDGTGSNAKAFSSIKFEVRYINLQKETSVASTVKKLMEVMGANPLAKNLLPLVSGPADFFISLSKAFVDNTVTKTKDNEEVDPQVRITLTLPPTTDCQGGGDKTGAIVVVRPFSTDYINHFNRLDEDEQERIKKKIMRIQPNTYCAKYLVDQEKRVLFAERQNGKCPDSDAAYKSYLNPYFVFTINAFPRPTPEVGGSPRSLVFVDPGMGIKPENGLFSSTPLAADQIKRVLQLAESHAKSKNKSLEWLGELYSRHTSGALKTQKLEQKIGGVKVYALTQQKSDLLTWAREQFGETGVTLAEQSGGLSDRIAQDLLAAAHRCKFFGVSESDCF